MTDALLMALLFVLVAAVVFLIYGQIKTLRALTEASESLRALADEARREGVPLMREARAAVDAAKTAAESLQALGPLLRKVEPMVDEAREAVARADETVLEARVTVGAAQRVLAQAESALGRLRLTDVALDIVKTTGGDAGRLAASAGLLVKSLWHKRSDKENEKGAKTDAEGSDGSDGNATRSGDDPPASSPKAP